MEEYYMPYIADKNLYKAVMLACKILRDEGHFNKAINSASKYYDIEKDEIIKYVRMRQGHGQKLSNKKHPRKYLYYAIHVEGDNGVGCFMRKATSQQNAESQIWEDLSGVGNFWFKDVKEFENKEDCEKCVAKMKEENY